EADITAGLPTRLADLAELAELTQADAAIGAAIAAFPDDPTVLKHLIVARVAIRATEGRLSETVRALHGHRLTRKLTEIDAAMALAANINVLASLSAADVAPGASFNLNVEIEPGLADSIEIEP